MTSEGRYKWVFRGPTPEAPIDWSVRVGEVLHNLRSCLNYIAYQSILDAGGQPTKGTAFPMAARKDRWEKESRAKVGSASKEDKRLMEYFQAHTGGLNLDCDVSILKDIVSLSNHDRHRSPVSVEIRWSVHADPLNVLYEAKPGISFDVKPFRDHHQVESGQVLLDISMDPSEYVDVRECFHPQFFVACERTFLPVSHLLKECLRYVSELLRVRELPGYGGIARPRD